MNTVRHVAHESPLGVLRVAASERGLCAVHMTQQRHMPSEPPVHWQALGVGDDSQRRIIDAARLQLDAYFAGSSVGFDVPLDLVGTPFQRKVWEGLRAIAYGRTISYGGLAERIGHPTAVRAVGLANGRNPVAIVVPCHRVIGADGSMTGYGGGVERKVHLLGHEARVCGARRSVPFVVA